MLEIQSPLTLLRHFFSFVIFIVWRPPWQEHERVILLKVMACSLTRKKFSSNGMWYKIKSWLTQDLKSDRENNTTGISIFCTIKINLLLQVFLLKATILNYLKKTNAFLVRKHDTRGTWPLNILFAYLKISTCASLPFRYHKLYSNIKDSRVRKRFTSTIYIKQYDFELKTFN